MYKQVFYPTIIFFLVWVILSISGAMKYPGSLDHYIVFSVVFLVVLVSGFFRSPGYGYLFLAVMLWLGFWLKFTVHLLLAYPFVEPVGQFAPTPSSWDKVLLIASVGGGGLMAGRLLYSVGRYPSTIRNFSLMPSPPEWYVSARRWLWFALIMFSICLAAANMVYGIAQSGLVPRTILIWPLNAVTYWLHSYGISFVVATFLFWDICLGKISWSVYGMLIEGFVSGVSILSRATYVFHTIPQLVVLIQNRTSLAELSKKNMLVFAVAFVVLLFASLHVVNGLRNHYYSGLPIDISFVDLLPGGFVVDRWVGLEGVMAVVAYPEKGWKLFVQALLERREIGKSSLYQEICLAHYRSMDMSKFQFASLPGPVAFFYFTGKLWMVFLGMVVIAVLVTASERLVDYLLANPLMNAIWGGFAASMASQMGVAPVGMLVFIFEMACGIIMIRVFQSQFFSEWVRLSANRIFRRKVS